MTLRELKAAVFRAAPELSDVLDNEALVHFLNECQRFLAYDSRHIEKKDIQVVDGIFALPSDCLVLRFITWDGYQLRPWPGDTLPEIQKGNPSHYLTLGNNVYLIPKADGTAGVYYTPKPQEMAADDDVPYYPNSDDVLVAYAIMNGYKILGDLNSATVWEKNYLERKQLWYLIDRSAGYRVVRVRNVLPWR